MKKAIKISQYLYVGLAIIFFLCLMLQVLLAGLAIFESAGYWLKHVTLIHLFGFNAPVFMLLFAYLGDLPRFVYWHLFSLLVLVFLMYFTANMQVSWIGSLHPVIAMILIAVAYRNIAVTMNWLKQTDIQKGEK
ncbi:hypothetical protein GMD78_13620 [Ornithinibacillus sp. L9]|uniref:Uncharacterized protein n=1 Tax=Ornithinibacillus caprae TaxID=2678566 RepID=A0A6N8FIB4_9BACI|nr:DUF6220 domain-containing protein [Ornithinibacillus caprae]MUK89402.1 hypothetical protein [Ornithinibacillus caprae]